ncbi:MAG: GMC family oxidoreductase [Deltaproteobacteria bacterium]|nr:GMC family oxidoreductase [Deltaproteobacteria bacterium]
MDSSSSKLSAGERRLLLALAEAATPAGQVVPSPDGETVARVEALLASLSPKAVRAYGHALRAVDLAALPLTGRRLSKLSLERRQALIMRLISAPPTHWAMRAATAPIKVAQVRRPGVHEKLHAPHGVKLPRAEAQPRWYERVMSADDLSGQEEIEVDVVVVGTGAGGAPMANALAARGHAVLMLEEGDYFGRQDFTGRAIEMQLKLFRPELTIAWGAALSGVGAIPVPIGMTVGGTTTINSGTCYRPTPELFRRWRFEHGLVDLDPESFAPYMEKVEAMLQVAPAQDDVLGGCGRVVARGAERLGWAHGPLPRNAPDCDGQGVCCFGCPTDAKRSTNVSYVPAALEHGAFLYTGVHVEEVLVEGGRAVGVVARPRDGGDARLRVRAKAVVLSCGTLHTPALLMKNDLLGGSGQLGRNLTLHPASHAWARFDERIEGYNAIPQGYGVDQFVDEGIRFEGAFVPLELAAAALARVGPSWTQIMDHFDEMACFGFMIADTSRGHITLAKDGTPRMHYVLDDTDRRKTIRGHGLLARLFLAAGARAVYPGLMKYDVIRDQADVERLEREGPRTLAARHLDLTAYHPLGTCRMGADPRRSVVGPTQEAHELRNLFIADGSVVNGPLGVNPQITIMSLSERASAFVEQRVESSTRATHTTGGLGAGDLREQPAQLEFTETMAGELRPVDGGRPISASFTVRVFTPDLIEATRAMRGEGGVFELRGEATLEGVGESMPTTGTLTMRPKARRGSLIYDLTFRGEDGRDLRLYGQKHVGLSTILGGMTTLHSELSRTDDEQPFARGILRFDLADVLPWLATFRLRRKPAAIQSLSSPSDSP